MTHQTVAQIIVLISGKSTTHDLRQDETVLGRARDCDISIDSNMVSSHHARIVRQGARHFIEDLKSTNHTFVNGKKIERIPNSKNSNLRTAAIYEIGERRKIVRISGSNFTLAGIATVDVDISNVKENSA